MGFPLNDSRVSPRAERLHRDALVVDLHADTPSEFFLDPSYDFGVRHEDGHVDLPRMREGGVDAEFMIAWVPAELASQPGAAGAHALRLVEAIRDVAARTPGTRLATSAAEIEAARESGDVALLIGVEGGHALENSLEMLARFHAAGVRYVTLTWNNANDWADACCSPPRHGGLTEFGREVVREMNRLGILVDVSHAADTTVEQVLEVSEAPILASHSCARALARLPRNLTDELARAIARRGGVIGVNFFPGFLDERYGARFDALMKEMEQRVDAAYAVHGDRDRARREAHAWLRSRLDALEPVPLDRLLDHVDHLVRVAGVDHVALGSDFDGVAALPAGVRDVADMPRITEGLLARGHSEEDVAKILGLNVLRLLREVTG
jgi:membrane dipeptidase